MTVVIPTHNRRALVARTLRTVLEQRGVELEVVAVDDGSSDGTADALLAMNDPRLRVERHARPLGVSAARNRGVELARGAWVAFLDDDDLWAPDKLARQIAAAERDGRVWAVSGLVAVTPALDIVSGGPLPSADDMAAALPWRNSVSAGASNVVVQRAALAAVGPFDLTLRHMADWDMWIRLGCLGVPAVVSEPDLAYLLHPGNASADTAAIPAEMMVLDERYRHLRGGRPLDRAYVYRWIGWNSLRTHRRRAAIGAYLRAAATGDIKSLARVAVALLSPGVAWGQSAQRPPAAWADRAAAWLAPLAATS